jgi:uncharacterized membrane protein
MRPPIDMTRVHRVEILISNLLRVGVISSLIIVVAGTVLTFVHHPQYLSQPSELKRLTSKEAAFPHTVRETAHGIIHLEGRSIVIVGLLLLIATPVMRVAVSIFAFVYQHDPTFVIITSVVLILLLLSFVLGKAGG